MKIKEIIVVEGKDDTVKVKQAVDCDTLETNGAAISESVLQQIELAQKTRGVIIFTDPDYPGEKIRKTIARRVPECKHAFLPKHLAKDRRGKKVGVEYADVREIRKALENALAMVEGQTEFLTKEDLLSWGFIGDRQSRKRRERLGEILSLGYANGKQLLKRLNMFQISREAFLQAAEQVRREEQTHG